MNKLVNIYIFPNYLYEEEVNMRKLTENELVETKGGEITVAAVMAVMIAAVMAVVIYRLFMSDKGSATIPGGFKFTWD